MPSLFFPHPNENVANRDGVFIGSSSSLPNALEGTELISIVNSEDLPLAIYDAHRVVNVEILWQCVGIQYSLFTVLVRYECFIECAHISLLWLWVNIAGVCASFRLSHTQFKWIMNIRCDKMHISNVSMYTVMIAQYALVWNYKWMDLSHACGEKTKNSILVLFLLRDCSKCDMYSKSI